MVLPCTFNHTSKWRPTTDIRVSWRLEGFHSKIFVFNYTNNTTQYTHHNYSDRIALVGDLQKNNASIQIAALKESDSNKYFCRVHMKISTGKEEFWQTLEGTNLTVSGGESVVVGASRPCALPPPPQLFSLQAWVRTEPPTQPFSAWRLLPAAKDSPGP